MKRTILSIEDAPYFRTLIRLALSFEGFDVIEASNGKDGLELAYSKQPDLILLDIIMPGMNGLEVCKIIQADDRLNTIPVVMLSSSDEDENIKTGLGLGAKAYLVKPFKPTDLVGLIRRLLADEAA